MFPIDILTVMCKSRKLWPLLPFAFLALLPVALFLIVATMAVHAGIGLLLWLKGCEYWLREWRKTARYERSIGRHWRACVADRARLHMADLTAWLHSRYLTVGEYAGKRWRRVVAWIVIGPIILLLAVPIVLLRDGLSKLAEWVDTGADALFEPIKRRVGNPLYRWSAR